MSSSPSKEEHIELIQYYTQGEDEAHQNQEIAADGGDSSKQANQSETNEEDQKKKTPAPVKENPTEEPDERDLKPEEKEVDIKKTEDDL